MALYVKRCSRQFITKLALKYIENYISLESLAYRYSSSEKTISNILYRGVVENILSDELAELVRHKMIYMSYKGHQAQKRWDKAFAERYANKHPHSEKVQVAIAEEEKRQYLIKKLEVLNFQLETFDDSHSSEQEVEKSEILDEISRIQRIIRSIKK